MTVSGNLKWRAAAAANYVWLWLLAGALGAQRTTRVSSWPGMMICGGALHSFAVGNIGPTHRCTGSGVPVALGDDSTSRPATRMNCSSTTSTIRPRGPASSSRAARFIAARMCARAGVGIARRAASTAETFALRRARPR